MAFVRKIGKNQGISWCFLGFYVLFRISHFINIINKGVSEEKKGII
jgi:hypothetical protein